MKTISSIRHRLMGTNAGLGNTILLIERTGWDDKYLEYLKTTDRVMREMADELKEHEKLERAR